MQAVKFVRLALPLALAILAFPTSGLAQSVT